MAKRRLIKNRTHKNAVFSVVLAVSAFLPFLLFCLCALKNNCTLVTYAASALSMPESAYSTLKSFVLKAAGKSNIFSSENKSNGIYGIISQKSAVGEDGGLNDSGDAENFDLYATPDDIAKAMKNADELHSNGEYTPDGVITPRTYTDEQANISYSNVRIKNVTQNETVNVESILENGCTLPDVGDEPAVLIYHTHSTESYVLGSSPSFQSDSSTKTTDKSLNMIRIGDEITRTLEAKGINVIHDRDIHDEKYTGAYDVSRQSVLQYMSDYPSIYMTLDIHRDALYASDSERIKPVTVINGQSAAQMMIIAGAEGSNTGDFENWQENLKFAVNLQKAAQDKYENIMKPIYFCYRKYNMDITPYSLLIEIGSDANTLEEAAFSGRILGDVLADFIKGKTDK